MNTIKLNLVKREDLGTSGAKKTRAEGMVPGIFYAKDSEPVAVAAKANELQKSSTKPVRPLWSMSM